MKYLTKAQTASVAARAFLATRWTEILTCGLVILLLISGLYNVGLSVLLMAESRWGLDLGIRYWYYNVPRTEFGDMFMPTEDLQRIFVQSLFTMGCVLVTLAISFLALSVSVLRAFRR